MKTVTDFINMGPAFEFVTNFCILNAGAYRRSTTTRTPLVDVEVKNSSGSRQMFCWRKSRLGPQGRPYNPRGHKADISGQDKGEAEAAKTEHDIGFRSGQRPCGVSEISGGSMRYNKSNYTPKHNKALQMVRAGVSNVEIADRLDVNPSTVSAWKRRAGLAKKLRKRTAEEWEAIDHDILTMRGCDVAAKHEINRSTVSERKKRMKDPTAVRNWIRPKEGEVQQLMNGWGR